MFKGPFTSSESESQNHKDKAQAKEIKEKFETSKKIFAFIFFRSVWLGLKMPYV